MRRATVTASIQRAGQSRVYRTPLGGAYFEQPLPSSLGASRAKGKDLSTANISTKGRGTRGKKRPLRAPLTAEGLKSQLRQLGQEAAIYKQRRTDEGEVKLAEDSHRDMRWRALHNEDETGTAAIRAANERSPAIVANQGGLMLLETGDDEELGNDLVIPGSSVLGSDLDRLERDMMRDYHQRGKELPHFDNVYATFGGGRRGKKSYHVLAEEYRQQMATGRAAAETGASARGVNLCRGQQHKDEDEAGDDDMLPPEANPHFPVTVVEVGAVSALAAATATATQLIGQAASSSYPLSSSSFSSPPHDAYGAQPVGNHLLELRGAEFWDDAENRERLRQITDYAAEGYAHEMLAEGVVDTSEVGYSANRVRRETLLYFQAHPINEMIQEPFVRIRSILPSDGEAEVHFPVGDADTDVDLPASQARRMARELGLDLIRVGAIHTDKNDRRVIALCTIADHREHMRDMIRFKMQKLGVQPPPTKECIEVPFRGGTHPHAIRFKSIGIAKHLLHRRVVRINLTKFGTPKEGFPVFRTILDEVKTQALQLKAYHTAGMVRANYNEVYCYLFPSTGRSPKTTVTHPTQAQLDATRDQRILEDEREIYFDDLNNKKTARERLAYIQKLEKGTAWADKDEGLSLQRQRDIKLMLGYLPKGNHELYAARGDVDIPSPFRASHPTSVERWTHPPETNLEQASRGAAVLGKRLAMTVSEMHDRQETADNPTTLDRFYYRLQGPALEAGELKEALGLKRNRKLVPRHAPGWGTLGMPKNPPEEPGYAAK
ncbi:uncharacterized protein Tco025E_00999 [Trypanosoma conorhini]|uniref:Uncharacterized protein n=1 Tax=Trypanosoma conorhini TaxID=83891 RepID=A0A422Q9Y4_9TRYP|nr:uncharacterized protein Tco025E_00999 [Trypanosoma conorhini]RNF26765.1 hypothetical protein Tco025E_00999 [Trypanosoma conorhini]